MSPRKLTPIPPCPLHELLISLLPSVPSQISLAYSVLPAPRPSQVLPPFNRESGAEDSCTSHSTCVQSTPHSSCRRGICPYLRPSCRRRHLRIFYLLLCAPAFSSAVTLLSAIKTVTLEIIAGSPILFLAVINRGGVFQCRQGL